MHACFHVQFQYHVCYRNKPFHSNTLLVLLLCYVTYRIVYRIVTTVSGYVSYCGKKYRCRPRWYDIKLTASTSPSATIFLGNCPRFCLSSWAIVDVPWVHWCSLAQLHSALKVEMSVRQAKSFITLSLIPRSLFNCEKGLWDAEYYGHLLPSRMLQFCFLHNWSCDDVHILYHFWVWYSATPVLLSLVFHVMTYWTPCVEDLYFTPVEKYSVCTEDQFFCHSSHLYSR